MDHRNRRAFDSRARRRAQAQHARRSPPSRSWAHFSRSNAPAASATGWALSELEPATSIGAAVTRFRPAFEMLCGEFETMLAGGERDRFERLYRELRNDVLEGELAHGLARLAFADHILSVLSLSFAREIEPTKVAHAYFELSAQLNFAILEEALQSIGTEDRWERRAANELADRTSRRAHRALLRGARRNRRRSRSACDESIEQLKRVRANRFAEVARLFEELKTLADPDASPRFM